MEKNRLTMLLAGLLLCLVFASVATAQNVSLVGTIFDRWIRPAPGLTIALIHPPTGMSFQVWTDGWGRFFFPNVPPRSDYELQVFRGPNMVFSMQVNVTVPTSTGVIRLP